MTRPFSTSHAKLTSRRKILAMGSRIEYVRVYAYAGVPLSHSSAGKKYEDTEDAGGQNESCASFETCPKRVCSLCELLIIHLRTSLNCSVEEIDKTALKQWKLSTDQRMID